MSHPIDIQARQFLDQAKLVDCVQGNMLNTYSAGLTEFDGVDIDLMNIRGTNDNTQRCS